MNKMTAMKELIPSEVLLLALELSAGKWLLGFRHQGRRCRRQVSAWDQEAFFDAWTWARHKLGVGASARTVSVHEAGRDGFSVHWFLCGAGIDSRVADSSSIEVPRRHRRMKTDRLDVDGLLRLLSRQVLQGEHRVYSTVRVPDEAVEDQRHLARTRETLQKEQTRLSNRIGSLLALVGYRVEGPLRGAHLERMRRWDGKPVSPVLRMRIEMEWQRLQLVREQLSDVLARIAAWRASGADQLAQVANQLILLKGIGPVRSLELSVAGLGWREFANRKQASAFTGLVPGRYQSGEITRDQGIVKASSGRLRAQLIELAWSWLRWQPETALSRWYQVRFAQGGKRMRKIGIVALARKLWIMLWHYVKSGELPDGVRLSEV